VALLASLPSAAFWQNLGSVVALSVAFAVTVWAGQRGYGPLKALLRVPADGGDGRAVTAEDTAGNEVALVAYTGVVFSCEFILAIAWVGVMRHGVDIAFDNDAAAHAASWGKARLDARMQGAAWLTALVAILVRGGFVVAFTTHRHHRSTSKSSGGGSRGEVVARELLLPPDGERGHHRDVEAAPAAFTAATASLITSSVGVAPATHSSNPHRRSTKNICADAG
jgi:hypothetical protein